MKAFFTNTILILLVRIFLGAVFIIASLDKIIHPDAFALSIVNYKVVGTTLSMVIATILPPMELLCGLGLILGIYVRSNALMISGMLVVFTVLVISALLRGLDITCGCFTQDPNASKIGYQKILENVGLLFLGIYLLVVRQYGMSIFQLFRKESKTQETDSQIQ